MLEIFDSFGKFAVFYVIAVAIVILGIVFNDELCELEDKLDGKIRNANKKGVVKDVKRKSESRS